MNITIKLLRDSMDYYWVIYKGDEIEHPILILRNDDMKELVDQYNLLCEDRDVFTSVKNIVEEGKR